MLTSTIYPNPFDNPELIASLVYVATEEHVSELQLQLVASELRDRGYNVTVREGRLNGQGYIPEVKFAENKETGGMEGIDTSHGHRWTINYDGPTGKYRFIDRKLGVTAMVPSMGEAQAMAVRAVGHETDRTPIDPYNEVYGAGKSSGENSSARLPEHPTVRPMYEDIEPLDVEKLRDMFPGHYLTK